MTLSTDPFHLIFITADPCHARIAAQAGVDRVMVDLEIIGKDARQGHLNTVISRHSYDDISVVKRALAGTGAKVLVRLNPVFDGSEAEIDEAIALGADRLMLPMFRRLDEVTQFLEHVGDRVPVTLLLETSTGLARLPQILALEGNYDLHIGLNDLHLEMGLDFMFELFSGGIVDHILHLCHAAGRHCGIGGVARLGGQGALPAEVILAEHARLRSSAVILSRDWQASLKNRDFDQAVQALRSYMLSSPTLDPQIMAQKVDAIATQLRTSRIE